MGIKEFIDSRNVEFTQNTIDKNQISQIAEIMGVQVGNELNKYILEYGYLSYEYVELYGVNSRQFDKSDMITQTIYLHKNFIKTKNYIALENIGDGLYVIVDEHDYVYKFDSEIDEIQKLEMKVFEYIVNRFLEIE